MDPLLGRYINRYLLAGKLGEGGMGAVYVAIQKPLGREVALKLISGIEITGSAIARFEREARAIALMDHPNIVKLHDYGIGDLEFQVPYMAIEYVRHGRTLRRAFTKVKRENDGQIPGDVVLTVFRQILNALSAAHEESLIHRDMKPDNVLIVPFAGNPHFVKVLDFGLAKAVSEVSGFDGDLSHTGLVLGTPHYMAPEQAPRSGPSTVDGRADLFAVTVMLYEVFTGRRPFAGDSALAILTSKTDPDHRPLEYPQARSLPRPLKAFLARGLSPDPADRFSDADQMLESLERALSNRRLTAMGLVLSGAGSSQDRPLTPPSPPPEGQDHEPTTPLEVIDSVSVVPNDGPSRPRWPYVLAPLAAIILVGGVAWLYSGDKKSAGSEGQTISAHSAEAPATKAPQEISVRKEPIPVEIEKLPQPVVEEPANKPPAPAPPVLVTKMFIVETSPKRARVKVDGKPIGRSPAKYEFTTTDKDGLQRNVRVSASASGYRTASMKVLLVDAVRDGTLTIKLKRKRKRYPKPKPIPEESPIRL